MKHLKLERFCDDILETRRFNLQSRRENAELIELNDDGKNKKREATFSSIVKFKCASVRDHILKIKRELGELKFSDIFSSSSASQIYLSEMVPSALHKLRLLAKTRAEKFNYKYVWTREGKLFVRKNDESDKIELISESDLDKMI